MNAYYSNALVYSCQNQPDSVTYLDLVGIEDGSTDITAPVYLAVPLQIARQCILESKTRVNAAIERLRRLTENAKSEMEQYGRRVAAVTHDDIYFDLKRTMERVKEPIMQFYYSSRQLERPKDEISAIPDIESALKALRRDFLDSIEDADDPSRSILEQKQEDFLTYIAQAKQLVIQGILDAAAEIENIVMGHHSHVSPDQISTITEHIVNHRKNEIERLYLQIASRSGPLRRLFENLESVIDVKIKQIVQEFISSANLALQHARKDGAEKNLQGWKESINGASKKAKDNIEHIYVLAGEQLQPSILDRSFWEDVLYYVSRKTDKLKTEAVQRVQSSMRKLVGCSCELHR